MTLITRFRNPVRAVLGAVTALDTDKQMYSDRAVDEAVKLVVETGLLPGYGLDTSVGGSVNDSVSPDVVSPGCMGCWCIRRRGCLWRECRRIIRMGRGRCGRVLDRSGS